MECDPNHINGSSSMESNCSFLSSMNLYLVAVGITGLTLNIFAWTVCYAKLRTQCHQNSRDVLLISLVLVDFFTASELHGRGCLGHWASFKNVRLLQPKDRSGERLCQNDLRVGADISFNLDSGCGKSIR